VDLGFWLAASVCFLNKKDLIPDFGFCFVLFWLFFPSGVVLVRRRLSVATCFRCMISASVKTIGKQNKDERREG
jgi:hypothetical protein